MKRMQELIEWLFLLFIQLETIKITMSVPPDRLYPGWTRGKARWGATNLQDVRENVILHGGIVHAHGAPSNLNAIQDEIVMLPADLSR